MTGETIGFWGYKKRGKEGSANYKIPSSGGKQNHKREETRLVAMFKVQRRITSQQKTITPKR